MEQNQNPFAPLNNPTENNPDALSNSKPDSEVTVALNSVTSAPVTPRPAAPAANPFLASAPAVPSAPAAPSAPTAPQQAAPAANPFFTSAPTAPSVPVAPVTPTTPISSTGSSYIPPVTPAERQNTVVPNYIPNVTPSNLEVPLSVGEWMLTILIMLIPCVNIIMMFVWAFGSGNKGRANYFKASLLWAAIILALNLILGVLFIALGISFLDSLSYYI